MACICLALLFSAATPSRSGDRDYAAETKAIIDRRGESASIVDCVLGTDQYDLSAGPMTDVAIDQLLESCRAQEAATAENMDPVDNEEATEPGVDAQNGSLAFTRSTESVPEGERIATLQAGLSPLGSQELGRLRDLCAAGSGIDCDRLFALSPAESNEEMFGLTCGDRPDVLDCADLVLKASPDGAIGPDGQDTGD